MPTVRYICISSAYSTAFGILNTSLPYASLSFCPENWLFLVFNQIQFGPNSLFHVLLLMY